MEDKTITTEEKQPMTEAIETTKEASIPIPEKKLPELDYSNASRQQLVDHLKTLISDFTPLEIKAETEIIKSVFYSKLTKEIEEQRKNFISENEDKDEDDDKPEFKPLKDELEFELKKELNRFRVLKNEILAQHEKTREDNLRIKKELIEELKQLVEKEESIKETFETFHAIVERWHTVGAVPASYNNDLWQNYHHHVEHFYDYIKINKDLRDLDFKKNLEKKEELCIKAEKLIEKESAIEAFKTLQILHQQWKECGPVEKDLREPLWDRFKAATTEINKRHQAYYTKQKELQIENLKKKEDLCIKAEELANAKTQKAKEWNDNVKVIQDLQAEWRTIGLVPKKENNIIYKRFRKACDLFFNTKREFYKQHKDVLTNNLEKKEALLERAIALKDSEDWKATTIELTNIQKEWKTIGAVPRKFSDKIWSDFRETCDHFFLKKKEHFGTNEAQQGDNLKLKEDLIEKIKAFETSDSPQDDIKVLLSYKDEWLKIGHVPFKEKNQINNIYHNELNAQFDKLNLKKEDRELEKYKAKVEDLTHNSEDRLYSERKRLSIKLKEMESDIATLENNIGFLSNSKSTEGLVKEYTIRIEKAKTQKDLLKKKIKMIDAVD